jgi:hypothetical protein
MPRFRLNTANISVARCLLLVIHHNLVKRNHWLSCKVMPSHKFILSSVCILSVFQETKNH